MGPLNLNQTVGAEEGAGKGAAGVEDTEGVEEVEGTEEVEGVEEAEGEMVEEMELALTQVAVDIAADQRPVVWASQKAYSHQLVGELVYQKVRSRELRMGFQRVHQGEDTYRQN